MKIKTSTRRLKTIAFFLFLIPTIALLGSLFIHNTLILFKFSPGIDFKFEKNLPGTTTQKFECTKENSYCDNLFEEKNKKLNKCYKFDIWAEGRYGSGEMLQDNATNSQQIKKIINEKNQKIFLNYLISEDINEACILNWKYIKFYNLTPIIFEKIYKIKNDKKTHLGTSEIVNPIIYGETSISNIVKRFPINYFFKPLMYISVILMILYWYYNNLIFNKITNEKLKNKFYIFGILSAIFLLLHVIFLGWIFETQIFQQIRRSFVVLFILFEVLAQAYLIKDIFRKKSELFKFLNNFVVYCKLVFVFFIFIATSVIIVLLITTLDSKIDYILEWNYFLILLIFYLLSSLMWKKINL